MNTLKEQGISLDEFNNLSKERLQKHPVLGDCILISHRELDNLIGGVMAVLDMNGDATQRNAQKSEIKMRIRSWLEEYYRMAGYYDTQTSLSGKTIGVKS